jgi:hypothetical protein
MKKTTSTLVLLLAVVTLTNCSPNGFQSNSSNSSTPNVANGINDGSNDSNNNNNGSNGSNSALDNIDLVGRVDSDNSNFKNALSFDFDKTHGEFIVMLPMPSGLMFTPPPGTFTNFPDIRFSTVMDGDTGKLKLAVRIPVKYIVKGIHTLPNSSLPNGEPLPTMPAGQGELPSLAIELPQSGNLKLSLYIGVNAIGLFMTLPTNIAIPFGFQLPIRNKDKSKTLGYISYVPAKGSFAPGLFLSTIIPPAVSRVLEDYFKL